MTLFQWIAVPLFGLILLLELLRLLGNADGRRVRLFRCLVWAGALAAIAHPELTSYLANAVGIDRGADLVFYLFILAFLFVTFFFYARHVKLQRQLTEVVRHLAVTEARRGQAPTERPTTEAAFPHQS